MCSLSDSVPSRHLFGAVPNYYRRSLQYSIVQKLFLGKYFLHPPAFQSSLWKCAPSVSSLSGSVPSRHLFGAIANYYRRSFEYSVVQKLFLGKSFPHPPASLSSLWKRVPPVTFLSGLIPSRHFFGTVLLPGVSPVLHRTETKFEGIFSTSASPSELSLEARPPVSFLSGSVPSRHRFGAVAVYYGRSLQYSIVQKLFLWKYFPHPPAFQRSLGKRVPSVSSLSSSLPRHRFGAVPNYHRRSL